MKCVRYLAMGIVVVWSLIQTEGVSHARVLIFSGNEIQEVSLTGMTVPEAGEYSVWVWSLDEKPVTVMVEGKTMHSEPPAKVNPGRYSWKQIGKVSIDEPGVVPVQIYSNRQGYYLEPNLVGWLAFSGNEPWNPVQWFDWTKVYANSPDRTQDKRVETVRTLNDYFSFDHYQSKWDWFLRKQFLKDQILVSMGCYPQPAKKALNAKVFGRIEHDDYTIEKVYFESLPGFFVTGNLYRPKGKPGPFPAVLCPHGHWAEGRLTNTDNNSIPGRCINFAKRGIVAFAIDMIGYVDSRQLDHSFGAEREWLWGLSLHGLQFWNSIRAVDFLCSLEDVDPERIGCTGASGGGTQTFMLMAIDERIQVAAPVNMLSSHFQGGCLCENGPNLRINLFNVEIGAMMAPRPLLMVSATGDWTDETLQVEYPAIQSIYRLFDADNHIAAVQIDAPHNYNRQSREAVYKWFSRWLLEDDSISHEEIPFTVDDDNRLRIAPDEFPSHAVSKDELIANWISMSNDQLNSLYPDRPDRLEMLSHQTRKALTHVLGVEQTSFNELKVERLDRIKTDDIFIEKLLLGREGKGDRIPAVLLKPRQSPLSGMGHVLAHSAGKTAWLCEEAGELNPLLTQLLSKGDAILLIDPFLTGEYHSPFQATNRNRHASHFLTYNQTETALRVRDIVTSVNYLQSLFSIDKVNLIGAGQAGLWCLLAAPLLDSVHAVVADVSQFDGSDDRYLDQLFVPGLCRAGGLRAAQALIAPKPLLIHNTAGRFDTQWAKAAYSTLKSADRIKVVDQPVSNEVLSSWIEQYR